MEKRVGLSIFIFLILINSILLTSAFTTAEEKANVNKAYSCLDNQILTKDCSRLSLDEALFTSLATGNCSSVINDSKDDTEACWPNGNCDLKTTSLAILANSRMKYNTSDAETWLLAQRFTPTNLIWYLEIDSDNATTCQIKYDSQTYSVEIGKDKKINNNAGTCLTKSFSDYWFSISKSCYDKEFEISCDKSFVTTLIFQRNTTEFAPYHVMKATHSASASGTTIEKIESYCFGTQGECNYEGSLWATMMLDDRGHNVSSYLPYLIDGWDRYENKAYMPGVFLYLITGKLEYKSQVLLDQSTNNYWDYSGDKYFDTGLAVWPFYSTTLTEKTEAKEWLFTMQTEDGCWNSNDIKDTSWVLYTIWPRSIYTKINCTKDLDCPTGKICKSGTCVTNGTVIKNCTTSEDCLTGQACYNNICIEDDENCVDHDYFCMASASCSGSILSQYDCTGTLKCCNKAKSNQTCSSLSGTTCTSTQYCSGTTRATDELTTGQTCCISGTCKTKTTTNNSCTKNSDCTGSKVCKNNVCVSSETEKTYACEDFDGSCESAGVCGKGYSEDSTYTCDESTDICCVKDNKSVSKLWLWILLILIALIVLGIAFREKISAFILRLKTKLGKGKNKGPTGGMLPGRPGPPMGPPPSYSRIPMRGHMERKVLPPPQRIPIRPNEQIRRPVPQPVKKPTSKSKEELDEVLKKLKEMSK
jgi:hypothetical protein